MTSIVDMLRDRAKGLVPVNVRLLASSVMGDRNAPITNADFTTSEIAALRKMYEERKAFNDAQPDKLAGNRMTEGEYLKEPKHRLKLAEGEMGRGKSVFRSEEIPYADYTRDLDKEIASYRKDPNKTSLGYNGDYEYNPVGDTWGGTLVQSFTNPKAALAGALGATNVYDEGNRVHVKDRYNFDNKQYYDPDNSSIVDMLRRYKGSPAGLIDSLLVKTGSPIDRPVDLYWDK